MVQLFSSVSAQALQRRCCLPRRFRLAFGAAVLSRAAANPDRAISWSHWAALIAAVVASAGLAIVFGPLLFLAFLLGSARRPGGWAIRAAGTTGDRIRRARVVSGRPYRVLGCGAQRARGNRGHAEFGHRRSKLAPRSTAASSALRFAAAPWSRSGVSNPDRLLDIL
jgi:hypothetical protein